MRELLIRWKLCINDDTCLDVLFIVCVTDLDQGYLINGLTLSPQVYASCGSLKLLCEFHHGDM